jgi:hypothetical protein
MAETTRFDLNQTSFESVEDNAGCWDYVTGDIYKDDKLIGCYSRTDRASIKVTPEFDVTSFTLTMFFSGRHPHANITLQGAWDCKKPGSGSGSVSSASKEYEGAIRSPFTIDQRGVTIDVGWD